MRDVITACNELTHSGRVVNLFDYVHAYTRGHHVTLETVVT